MHFVPQKKKIEELGCSKCGKLKQRTGVRMNICSLHYAAGYASSVFHLMNVFVCVRVCAFGGIPTQYYLI